MADSPPVQAADLETLYSIFASVNEDRTHLVSNNALNEALHGIAEDFVVQQLTEDGKTSFSDFVTSQLGSAVDGLDEIKSAYETFPQDEHFRIPFTPLQESCNSLVASGKIDQNKVEQALTLVDRDSHGTIGFDDYVALVTKFKHLQFDFKMIVHHTNPPAADAQTQSPTHREDDCWSLLRMTSPPKQRLLRLLFDFMCGDDRSQTVVELENLETQLRFVSELQGVELTVEQLQFMMGLGDESHLTGEANFGEFITEILTLEDIDKLYEFLELEPIEQALRQQVASRVPEFNGEREIAKLSAGSVAVLDLLCSQYGDKDRNVLSLAKLRLGLFEHAQLNHAEVGDMELVFSLVSLQDNKDGHELVDRNGLLHTILAHTQMSQLVAVAVKFCLIDAPVRAVHFAEDAPTQAMDNLLASSTTHQYETIFDSLDTGLDQVDIEMLASVLSSVDGAGRNELRELFSKHKQPGTVEISKTDFLALSSEISRILGNADAGYDDDDGPVGIVVEDTSPKERSYELLFNSLASSTGGVVTTAELEGFFALQTAELQELITKATPHPPAEGVPVDFELFESLMKAYEAQRGWQRAEGLFVPKSVFGEVFQQFTQLDDDHSGEISATELAKVLEISPEEAEDVIFGIRGFSSDSLDFVAFLHILTEQGFASFRNISAAEERIYVLPSQIRRAQRHFRLIDTEGKGKVLLDVVKTSKSVPKSLADRLSKRVDASGYISVSDFVLELQHDEAQFIQEEQRALNKKLYRTAVERFCDIDQDFSGQISKDELEGALNTLGLDISKEELDNIFSQADIDQSGQLELQEFIELLKLALDSTQVDPQLRENLHKSFFDILGTETAAATATVTAEQILSALTFRIRCTVPHNSDFDLQFYLQDVCASGEASTRFTLPEFVELMRRFPYNLFTKQPSKQTSKSFRFLSSKRNSSRSLGSFYAPADDKFESLSLQERQNFRNAFDYFDTDLSGEISMGELQKGFTELFQKFNPNPTEAELNFIFTTLQGAADRHTSSITFKQFVNSLLDSHDLDVFHGLMARAELKQHMETEISQRRYRTSSIPSVGVFSDDLDGESETILLTEETMVSDHPTTTTTTTTKSNNGTSENRSSRAMVTIDFDQWVLDRYDDLTPEERHRFRLVFNYFDPDGSETVSMSELYEGFTKLMQEADHTPSEEENNFVFQTMSLASAHNKDSVSFEEFVLCLLSLDDVDVFYDLLESMKGTLESASAHRVHSSPVLSATKTSPKPSSHDSPNSTASKSPDIALSRPPPKSHGTPTHQKRQSLAVPLPSFSDDSMRLEPSRAAQPQQDKPVKRDGHARTRSLLAAGGLSDSDDEPAHSAHESAPRVSTPLVSGGGGGVGQHLSKDEQLFNTLDTDKDGKVKLVDVANHIAASTPVVTQLVRDLSSVFGKDFAADQVHLDKDRFVQFMQLLAKYISHASQLAEQRLRNWCLAVFRSMDKNRRGVLSVDDLREAFKQQNLQASTQALQAFVELSNGTNQVIEFEGFFRMVKSQFELASGHNTLLSHPLFGCVHEDALRAAKK